MTNTSPSPHWAGSPQLRLCGHREMTRSDAHIKLTRLSAEQPGDNAIWKSTIYVGATQWGHAVVRADGPLVPAGAVGAFCPCGESAPAACNRAPTYRTQAPEVPMCAGVRKRLRARIILSASIAFVESRGK
jgi:hypothetical protein